MLASETSPKSAFAANKRMSDVATSATAHEALPTLVVYYNTRCPVCDAGIGFQNRRLVKAAREGTIVFRDINAEPDALQAYAVTLNEVRRRLHAVDDDGKLYVGIDCAAAIWQRTPGDAWLARLVDRPIVHGVAALGYDRFADLLYAWNRWKRHW